MRGWIVLFALLLAGCGKSQPKASLSAEQAATEAIRLANDKAFALYQSRPFQPGKPAQFVAGHWIWSDQRGFGYGDIQATVELTTNGAPQNVHVSVLDNRAILGGF
jgi:hypothetical protein